MAKNKNIIILSPHPDDECLNGLLPLRLKEYDTYNFVMTLGSNPAHKKQREQEVLKACDLLGFTPFIASFNQDCIKKMNELSPALIILPHAFDKHPTHIKVHDFFIKNLVNLSFNSIIAFTEYWFPQKNPNLLVELIPDQIDLLTSALRSHLTELSRNNYDETFKPWLIDNCRRGFEYLEGFGKNTGDFKYGNLYELKHLHQNKLISVKQNHIVTKDQCLFDILSSLTISS
jgi:N-acetylglucosamine malate deacetylase 1